MRKFLERFEGEILKYATALLILAVPLYPKFPLIRIPGSWVSVRLEDFLIAVIFLFWLQTIIPRRHEFFKNTLNRLFLIYFAIGFLSFLTAVLVTKSVSLNLGFLHTLRRIEYMGVFFIAVSSVRKPKDLLFYFEVFFLTVFLVFLYGIGQKFFGLPVISTMNVEFAKGLALHYMPGARVNATFAGHYDLGAWLVLLVPIIVATFFTFKKIWQKLLTLLVFLSSFWLLLASASRISFAAYLVTITLTLWFIKRKAWILPILIISIFASFFSTPLASRYSQAFQVSVGKFFRENNIRIETTALVELKEKFIQKPTPTPTPTPIPVPQPPAAPPGKKTVPPKPKRYILPTPTPTPSASKDKRYFYYGGGDEAPPEDRSTAIRINVEWPRALRAFAKSPLLGTGFSSITLATDNDYLRSLGEVGLLGFITFTTILGLIFWQGIKIFYSEKKENLWFFTIGILGGMLGFFANAFFIDVFEASKAAITFWLLSGLLVGISRLKLLSEKER